MKTVLYHNGYKDAWNDLIYNSPNRLFLLLREYMDYHADKFRDHSLLFFDQDQLLALLPANIKNDVLYSHGGLTYGGLVSQAHINAEKMVCLFACLKDYAQHAGIKKLIYKPPPVCYRESFAEEELYALFTNGAQLVSRNLSSCIDLTKPYSYRKSKKRSVRKAIKNNVIIKKTTDYGKFFQILSKILQEKHQTKPVHSIEEIKLLSSLFPENIQLYAAYIGDHMLAGTVIYEYSNMVHTQYIAVSSAGKPVRALDYLIDWLITHYNRNKKYFDFGVSTEDKGHYLNTSLIFQKEGFGAKGLCYDTYELSFL
ncbi:MAG TPA: GNAT family N-acetyltransferase [Saprospiraceae bacterium]|nr:GNAT family N-acetyltransferase [Saprospiraceae bacterium]